MDALFGLGVQKMNGNRAIAKLPLGLAVLCCGLMLASPASTRTFHAVLVGDTQDASIGASAVHDVEMATRFADGVARHYDDRRITVLTGARATPNNIKRTVAALELDLEDFVFLYYTGHGTSGTDGSPWPKLVMGSGEVDARDVLLDIQKHAPMRLLAVFDACNGEQEMPTRRRPASADFRPEHVKSLFHAMRGTVVITSSGAPYVSYADPKGRGSRFSNELYGYLADVLSAPVPPPSWERILADVSSRTGKSDPKRPQVPKFAISPQHKERVK